MLDVQSFLMASVNLHEFAKKKMFLQTHLEKDIFKSSLVPHPNSSGLTPDHSKNEKLHKLQKVIKKKKKKNLGSIKRGPISSSTFCSAQGWWSTDPMLQPVS